LKTIYRDFNESDKYVPDVKEKENNQATKAMGMIGITKVIN